MAQSILIPAHVFDKVSKKLAKLCGKAGAEYALIDGETALTRQEPREYIDAHGETRTRWMTVALPCKRVTIGDVAQLTTGWKLIARVEDHLAELGENLVMVAFGADAAIAAAYRCAAANCDHCGHKRARKDTMIVQNIETGEVKQVGRNCLGDFILGDPTALLAHAEMSSFFSRDEESMGWGGGWEVSTLEYVAAAVASCEVDGFKPSSFEASTKDRASFITDPMPLSNYSEVIRDWKASQAKPEHVEIAKAILAWGAGELATSGASDYERNLSVALRLGDAEGRRRGLLASAPKAYGVAVSKKAESAAPKAESSHIGKPGTKLEATVKLVRRINCEMSTLFAFETLDGCDVSWFCSGKNPVGPEDIGKTFQIKGTVKAHNYYKGRAQTLLTRVKVLSV